MLSPAQMKFSMRLVLLSLIFCMSACSSLLTDDFRDPTIHLVKVEVVKAKLLEQKFNLYFRAENPNDFSLEIGDLDYSVYLNDILLANGQSSMSISIPAKGASEFKIPVRANLWRNLKQVLQMLKTPDEPIRYRLEGQVEAGSWFGRTIKLSRSGQIVPGNFIPE